MANIVISNIALDYINKAIKVSSSVLKTDYPTKEDEQSAAAAQGFYLKGVHGDTQVSFVCANEPSSMASHFVLESKIQQEDPSPAIWGDDGIYYYTEDETPTAASVWRPYKIINYSINLSDVITGVLTSADINKDLFFIFTEASVTIQTTESIEYVCGVTFNQNDLYQTVFDVLHKSITKKDCCRNLKVGEDIVLLYMAFQLSWSKADPRKYIYYWNQIHNPVLTTKNSCGCNG